MEEQEKREEREERDEEAGAGRPGDAEEAREEAAGEEALRRELEQARALAAEYLETAQRLKADFDNYRRRMFQEQARWKADGVAEAVAELLPVADNLERALAAGGENAAALRQGVELTLRQLREALGRLGVEAVESVGHPFDPSVHEAVQRVEGSGRPEGEVVGEIRKGYRMRERLLRPALVAVAAGAEAPAGRAATAGGGETAAGDGESTEGEA
ncbi:MAG: nucleotide exchange factor GrpE [Firmicutes bacterium]|nr:nucleotide exchange factor GrpE [Bacillota bacterium]